MATSVESLPFQAETKELLSLMIHSLYTNKDIFLRELISNASDALDRLRFESITQPELLAGDDRFEIRIHADRHARTLTVSDTGIGMRRDEVVEHIGTIAKSGTRELRRKIQEAGSEAATAELIGQFGVGFYSAFMVADKVKLVTRRAGEDAATEWESAGEGTYTIAETSKPERGTSITLYLKTPDPESGVEDYTDSWRLATIVRRYSDFINYPILQRQERDAGAGGDDAESKDEKEKPVEDKTLNSMKPIWKRSPAEVKPEEYNEFYKHLSHDWTEPLKTIHFKAEGAFEYEALLYLPSQAPFDLYYVGAEHGLRLFAKRVMIMEKCEDLLPRYLRFVRGVVDAAELPLNISRQRLQQDRHIALIQKRLTRKVLDALQDLFDNDRPKYLTFWGEFGAAMKEGVGSDFENKDKLAALLLFASSQHAEEQTTLKDYAARMQPGQEQIYYLTGESRALIENSPHLEAVRAKGYEVLFLTDRIDEILLQYLPEFDGKKLKSVGKGVIDLGSGEEKEEADKELKQLEGGFRELIDFLAKQLDQHVKQVRLSNRLTNSPVCLVVDDHDYSPMLERALQHAKAGAPKQRRVLELNPKHPLIARMRERYAGNPADPMLVNAAEVLFGLGLLSEGSDMPDPVKFNRAASELLAQVL